jgi:ATP-dependent helicase YprA (DUF1998 family)/very-short-patch-repair endonuclease
MNPLRIARALRDDYLTLLRTTFRPRQDALREIFDREIERENFLTREPFVSLAQPYRRGSPVDWLCAEATQRFGVIAQQPFLHQTQAARRISDGLPTVIATGTGSGKTEAFLMPIIDHCLDHRSESGLKAILVYPMNALVTDQLRRVRVLLAGSGVSFGRYTGETQLAGQRPGDIPEEERFTRTEFRSQPPHILLTNYQMLEFMLLRGDGRDIFRGHNVRFIVLDEVHTYHGALGTDVACLLRRLRASLSKSAGNVEPALFVGTSATLQSRTDEEDPCEGVARFFTRLTGQETPAEGVITEVVDPPTVPEGLGLPPSPHITEAELDAFDHDRPESVTNMVRRLAGIRSNDERSLSEIWQTTKLPYLLLSWLRRPMSIRDIALRLGDEPERDGVDEGVLRREVEAALLLGPCLPEEHPLRLRPRVHRFLRGLARFWRCTNPDCGRLMNEGVETCTHCGARTLPLAICRTCGWDFFVARENDGRAQPWPERTSSRQTTYYFDPPAEHLDADTEDNPMESDEEPEEMEEAIEEGDTGEEEVPVGELYLCPRCLSVSPSEAERNCTCGEEFPLRALAVHHGRGTRCPVCRSRYGRFDVLTPVSLGNSSALTHVARTLLRELPEENRKILVFCDSRQDAAHQARFIEGVEGHLRLRRAVYRLLSQDAAPHDLHWLVENIYHEFVEQGLLPRTRSRDRQRREMDKIEGGLLSEFVLASNVRHSLERLGLVTIQYAGLDQELESEAFRVLCERHQLALEPVQLAVRCLLGFMRGRFAVSHEIFRTRLYRGDRLSSRFGLTPGRQVGLPVAFQLPGNRSDRTANYKLISTWNTPGAPAGVQRLWRRILGEDVTMESLADVLTWLAQEEGWLVWTSVGRQGTGGEGYHVAHDVLEFQRPVGYAHCDICGRAVPGEEPGHICPRPGCDGHLVSWEGPLAENNLHATLIAAEFTPALRSAEHSAAVGDDRRQEIEQGFQTEPPSYNVLVCTPTLELGVNIGDLEAVSMRNVPPSPANYAQRAGRTGRRSRMGLAAGFARNTPHDGYFFDHPDEVIAGAIPPPRFNLGNLEAVARHVRSLVLEEARLEYPANLETMISDSGAVNAVNLQNMLRQVTGSVEGAINRARDVFGPQIRELREDWEAWLENTIRQVPSLVQSSMESRASLIEDAARRMRELGNQVRQTQRQQDAEQGFRNLARKLREDYRYAYLPRVLAEVGILPGYSFPGDPGSLSLAYDPNPIFTGRLQAQREFAPGQVVYARGHRWRVGGLALNRPGSRTQGAERFEFTECPACGLAAPASGANNCTRCGAELEGASCLAWDAGAFQAWPADLEPETEEERQSVAFDVRVHPQRNVSPHRYSLGAWTFELRSQEEIWWINHGPYNPAEQHREAVASGFRLCPICGELRPEQGAVQGRRRRDVQRNVDARADRDPHDDRCGGNPVTVAIGHQDRADTLRLMVPGLQSLGFEGVIWAWSLAWAVIRGAIRLFDLDEDDIEARVLTRRLDGQEEVLELIWVDSVLGGSGILQEIVEHFPQIARSVLDHLREHDCPSSCYRCLKTYRNQRVHGLLDWRLAVPQLLAASLDNIRDLGSAEPESHSTEGPEWDEARREGCGSPLELRLLQAMRTGGFPEPEKQFEVQAPTGRLITVADFAYPGSGLLIYVDGLAFHSSLRRRIHDTFQTNQLQNMGYRVLRFVGAQVLSSVERCIAQILEALAASSV